MGAEAEQDECAEAVTHIRIRQGESVRRGQEDASLVAAGFDGRTGLEAELLALDLAAAKTRVEGILATVKTDDSTLLLTTLLEDLGLAIGAFEGLADAHGKDE